MDIYQNAGEPIGARVKDLMGKMTLDEKVAQLCAVLPQMLLKEGEVSEALLEEYLGKGLGRIPQFPMPFHRDARQIGNAYNAIQKYALEKTRLGIPVMAQVECLNGVVAVDATAFPSPIAVASTWEPRRVRAMGHTIGRQMRAMVNGANALAPVVDLARDARWGRVYETFGESSYINAQFGMEMVRGLQHDGNLAKGVQSCAKHFLGYSATQAGLNSAPVMAGSREIYEDFGKPFEAMIQKAGLQSVMCTYSEIDGTPVSFSPEILRDLLRGKMGFTGSAICDGGSIERACFTQHAAADLKEAAVLALKAGLDADAPRTEAFVFLPEAVREGLIGESYVDEACARVLTQKFQLGLFDSPYVDVEALRENISTIEDRALSLELSRKSLILLKNRDRLLPLNKNIKSLAIIGPHANSIIDLFGGYTFPSMLEAVTDRDSGFSMLGVNEALAATDGGKEEKGRTIPPTAVDSYCKSKYGVNSLVEEIGKRAAEGSVAYAKGCHIDDDDTSLFGEALRVAGEADVIVMTLGGKSGWTNRATSGEGRDRTCLDLPGVQEKLLKEVKALGKPVVLVLFHGRPLSINWAAENADAILDVWFPGPYGGQSIAEALFGEINPGGKLPVSIPRSSGQCPIYHDHKWGAGYRRDTGGATGLEKLFGGGYTDIPSDPLYHFGYGMSYTEFAYPGAGLSGREVPSDGAVSVTAVVENVGDVTGDEVVQFYIRDREARVTRPAMELVGFQRVTLAPGEKCEVVMDLPMSQLGFLNENREFVVEPGNMDIMVGSSSDRIHHTLSFAITGEIKPLAGIRSYSSALSVRSL